MTPADRERLIDDLVIVGGSLCSLAQSLTVEEWNTPSPAPGWDVRDQFAHLARFDGVAANALTEPQSFAQIRDALLAESDDVAEMVAQRDRSFAPASVLQNLVEEDQRLIAALRHADWDARVPWFGPPMSVPSCATARLMEKFAHGQDIADALGVPQPAMAGLRHIAHLGVRTFGVGFVARGLPVPTDPVRVVLSVPGDVDQIAGPPEALNTISGSQLDFCLVVTQRRHHLDTDLRAVGTTAHAWLETAQAFAGPPGAGREGSPVSESHRRRP